MLAIRLQRIGRKGLPVYRLAVQESHRHPSSGRVVAYVGSLNPHSKAVTVNKEKVEFYLKNGAQPTSRVVRVLKEQGVKMPSWVNDAQPVKERAVRNPEKLQKNQPKAESSEPVETPAEAPTEE